MTPRAPPADDTDTLPRLAGWITAGAAQTPEDAAFCSGAALARAAGWAHLLPLLATGLKPRELRARGADLPRGADRRRAVLDCADPLEARRLRPARLAVILDGAIVAQSEPMRTTVQPF